MDVDLVLDPVAVDVKVGDWRPGCCCGTAVGNEAAAVHPVPATAHERIVVAAAKSAAAKVHLNVLGPGALGAPLWFCCLLLFCCCFLLGGDFAAVDNLSFIGIAVVSRLSLQVPVEHLTQLGHAYVLLSLTQVVDSHVEVSESMVQRSCLCDSG